MDYSQLSDFEINKLVAESTGTQVEETYQFVNGGEDIADHMSGIVLMRKITSNRKHWKLYDPCHNPSDAWPIIDENDITVINDLPSRRCAVMSASAFFNGAKGWEVRAYDANGMRAAMIVFLMMQDAKHD